MRLWSIHPKYLDSKGLTACWREALLARKVLSNQTTGYKNHPQLKRFLLHLDPISAVNSYLLHLYDEASTRDFAFDHSKLVPSGVSKIPVTAGQIIYEMDHLKRKLWKRDRRKYFTICKIKIPEPNPLFRVIEGDLENWERIIY
ncbi:MAG TPA: pyrimidine dimer DNA glycosylase/endonuclease V [Ignavibacteriaceae bacterium]|nr:pyrimidine dimer DNA glycosylase/endonuclease V [Ignavibacteriaceae bacterium]